MPEKEKKIVVPGICSGKENHPEMLWIFERTSPTKIQFQKVETDCSIPPDDDETFSFQKFFADMDGFEGCPFCETSLYFFCKKCQTMSCFSWETVDSENIWKCPSCRTNYRMKPKTSPFQVSASVDSKKAGSKQPRQRQQTLNSTLNWHPAKK